MLDFQKYWDKKWFGVVNIGATDFALKVLNFIGEKRGLFLDIGSGAGRDSLYFSENGFEVESLDFSKNALSHLTKFAKEKGLGIKTIFGDILNYDFEINKYDFIYACNSLHYFSDSENKTLFEKLKKSLKKDGSIFIRVKSLNDLDFGKGEKIEENYFKNGEDYKHFFDKDYMKSFFLDFEILKLEEKEENHNKINGLLVKSNFIDILARKV